MCTECRVFGHSIGKCPKLTQPKPPSTKEVWQVVGSGKGSSTSPPIDIIEAAKKVSVNVPLVPSTARISTTISPIIAKVTEPDHTKGSSMLNTLMSNSFYVLEESSIDDQEHQGVGALPRISTSSPSSQKASNERADVVLDENGEDSPLTPLTNAHDFGADFKAVGGSKKAAKKAAKAARSMSSSNSKKQGKS
jgi:hypothetical protein